MTNLASPQTELKKRNTVMSARQVAIAAVFGGITFAFEALKITIPFYLPGVSMNFGGLWLTLGTAIAGPWAGGIIMFLDSLPSEVGLWGWPGYMIHVMVLALLYKQIYKIANRWIRVVAFWVWNMFALFLQYWYWIILYAYIFKLMPLKALITYNFLGGPYVGFMLIYNVVPALLLLTAPEFMKPDWSWFGKKK
ncbi:MAG: hypothetical protein M1379_13975 [Firmicutes bacterium]|nr:hypothetical protein [Bacillota bacterium]